VSDADRPDTGHTVTCSELTEGQSLKHAGLAADTSPKGSPAGATSGAFVLICQGCHRHYSADEPLKPCSGCGCVRYRTQWVNDTNLYKDSSGHTKVVDPKLLEKATAKMEREARARRARA